MIEIFAFIICFMLLTIFLLYIVKSCNEINLFYINIIILNGVLSFIFLFVFTIICSVLFFIGSAIYKKPELYLLCIGFIWIFGYFPTWICFMYAINIKQFYDEEDDSYNDEIHIV